MGKFYGIRINHDLPSIQLIYTALAQCWASADNIVQTRKQARFAPPFDECFFHFTRNNSD